VTRVGLLLVAGLAACIAAPTRGHPLYASAAPLRADQVAVLAGYVARVDGRDVRGLGTVEVLPGCHVVETPERWSAAGRPAMGALVATTGPLTFVLHMAGGRRFDVRVDADLPTGPRGGAAIYAQESGQDGAPLRRVGFIREGEEGQIDACASPGGMNNYPHGE